MGDPGRFLVFRSLWVEEGDIWLTFDDGDVGYCFHRSWVSDKCCNLMSYDKLVLDEE